MPTYIEISKPNTLWNTVEKPAWYLMINSLDFLLINEIDRLKLIISTDLSDIYSNIPKPTTTYNNIPKPE